MLAFGDVHALQAQAADLFDLPVKVQSRLRNIDQDDVHAAEQRAHAFLPKLVRHLGHQRSSRKIIVIISDGFDNDSQVTAAAPIQAARQTDTVRHSLCGRPAGDSPQGELTLNRLPEHIVDALDRSIDWYDRHFHN